MSLVTVHLRWDDVGQEQYEKVISAGRRSGELPAGCLSRQVRQHGNALLATEVWDSQVAGDGFDGLVRVVKEADVEERPQSVMFAVPQMFATAYRRAARPAEMAIPHLPGPRQEECLPAPSQATDAGAYPADRRFIEAADSTPAVRP